MESNLLQTPAQMRDSQSGQFLPVRSLKVHSLIDGPLAKTSLVISYENTLGAAIEADLVFPLPPSAALRELKIRSNECKIDATIKPRDRAQAEYNRAKQAGQTAALGESDGEDLARIRVAPVDAGETVEATLVLHHLLEPVENGHRLVIPLTYMPRFVEKAESLTAIERAAVDRERPAQLPAVAKFTASVIGVTGKGVTLECLSHEVTIENYKDDLMVKAGPFALDRDLVLAINDRPVGDSPSVWFRYYAKDNKDGLGPVSAVAIIPPRYQGGLATVARTVTYLVDRSASMAGPPMLSALAGVRESLRALTENDRFNILLFDHVVETFASRPVLATAAYVAEAEKFLSTVVARGGTNASGALALALGGKIPSDIPCYVKEKIEGDASHRLRIIVFMTDGDVANAANVLETSREQLLDTRVHVLGIGYAVNHSMLGELARKGGGAYYPVPSEKELEKALKSLSKSIWGPIWTAIKAKLRNIAGTVSPQNLEPTGPVDLFVDRPLLLAWRGECPPRTQLILTGQRPNSDQYSLETELNMDVPEQADPFAPALLWALLRNRRLTYGFNAADDANLEQLGVDYGLVNRMVALVGVDENVRQNEAGESVSVSLPLPANVRNPNTSSSGATFMRRALGVPAAGRTGFINYMSRDIRVKIVYYGPGFSGKHTNLSYLHSQMDPNFCSKYNRLATESEASVQFTTSLPDISQRGFRLWWELVAHTGTCYYESARAQLLKGVNGVVFVADSDAARLEANLESLDGLEQHLKDMGMNLENFPLVIQYNKRDLIEVLSIEELRAALNPRRVPDFEACATSGQGVSETYQEITKLVAASLRSGG